MLRVMPPLTRLRAHVEALLLVTLMAGIGVVVAIVDSPASAGTSVGVSSTVLEAP